MLAGILIAGGALLWIGALDIFKNSRTYVTFSDSSVEGLDTGTRVKYLGLDIGEISSLSLVPSHRLVRILMSLKSDFKVQEWMAVQKQFGGITRGNYLGIVQAPQNLQQVTPKIDFATRYPVIPSLPGQVEQAMQTAEKVFGKLQSLNIDKLISEWEAVARHADAVFTAGNLQEAGKNIETVSRRLLALSDAIAGDQNAAKWNKILADITAAADSARKATARIESQMAGIPPGKVADISKQADNTIREIEKASKSVDAQISQAMRLLQQDMEQLNRTLIKFENLADSLRQQPGRVLTQPQQQEPFTK